MGMVGNIPLDFSRQTELQWVIYDPWKWFEHFFHKIHPNCVLQNVDRQRTLTEIYPKTINSNKLTLLTYKGLNTD